MLHHRTDADQAAIADLTLLMETADPDETSPTLLQDAQNLRSLAQSPWLLIPGLFVIATVLCFNFIGDGLRDAADPYKR